jgi:RNA binding exosome subunit
MNINEFMIYHNEKSKKMPIFNSLEALEFNQTERKITIQEVTSIENIIGFDLPKKYIDFCIEFGGGYFGNIAILSLDINGEWYFGNVLKALQNFIPENFIPFCDDQTSGYYCFKVFDQHETIYYLDSAGIITALSYDDFFDFIIKNAY